MIREQATAGGRAEAAGVYHPICMARQARRGPTGYALCAPQLLAALAACGDHAAPAVTPGGSVLTDLADGPGVPPKISLVVVAQDAGEPLPDGGRAGALLLVPADGTEPKIIATDPRWLDPADALRMPDGSWLVLESHWPTGQGEARGAI